MIPNNKKISVVIIVWVVVLASIPFLGSYPESMTSSFFPMKSVKETHLLSRNPASTTNIPTSSCKEECTDLTNQTVVEWKHMYWFPCKLGWKEICLWPFGRRHVTYKVTLNGNPSLLDEKGKAVPVAKGKVRDWFVYNSETWNAIENNPREKKRYLDYEKIASNEYVVMVETRYRLFNVVESTLRICFQ